MLLVNEDCKYWLFEMKSEANWLSFSLLNMLKNYGNFYKVYNKFIILKLFKKHKSNFFLIEIDY